jgi:hypothetical protein
MTKKFGVFAGLCALWLGFGIMSAQAQAPPQLSQTFYFNGTCNGTDQVFTKPFTPTFTGEVTGGDIVVSENPPSGINYAFGGFAGSTNVVLWAGPGQTHVTSFPGFAGFGAVGNFPGGGFAVTTTTLVVFDLSCDSGPWQAFMTLWYHVP